MDSLSQYRRAAGSIDRLGTGPWRGKVLDMAIPEEGGGFGDTIGAATVGGAMGLFGGLPEQTITDFQNLKGLQSGRVLKQQIAQKGPQTESDAARMKLTEISPSRTKAEIGRAHV